MNFNTKGQLSVFMIIGIIVLFVVGFIIYVRVTNTSIPGLEGFLVPRGGQPVYDVVVECADQLSTSAVLQLGLQGGFVEVPSDVGRNPEAYVQLEEAGLFKIPFWYYEGQDRTPGLEFMQTQISRFVLERLRQCTNDFEEFQPEYAINVSENLSVRTVIGDESVDVRVNWPLTVKRADTITSYTEYGVSVPARLRRVWELAKAVMQFENKEQWFENFTIDLYAADPEIPTDGLTVDCASKKWYLRDVKERMQRLLYYNLPRIRVENTDFARFDEPAKAYESLKKFTAADIHAGKVPSHTPDDAYEYRKMTLRLPIKAQHVSAGFDYQQQWGMLLNAQPNDGGVLRANLAPGAQFMRFLCLNQWHFTYNIIYPVRLLIREPQSFLGRGYFFQMAFPVIINNNQGERLSFGYRRFEPPQELVDFCDKPSEEFVDIRALSFEPGLPVETEIDGVNITYDCFSKFCNLGTTKADDGIYRLRTQLPEGCTNPFITAAKEGYATTRAQLTSDHLDLELKPLTLLNVTVYKHAYDAETNEAGPAEPLGTNDRVTFYLKLKDASTATSEGASTSASSISSSELTEFDQTKQFPLDKSVQFLSNGGAYELTALLLQTDIFTGKDFLTGGYVHENYIPGSVVAGSTGITLHVLELRPLPTTDAGQQKLATALYSDSYQNSLKPDYTS